MKPQRFTQSILLTAVVGLVTATLTVTPDGALRRPDYGQPPRYRIAGPAEQPATLIERLINREQ
jgi:hypothetical protein